MPFVSHPHYRVYFATAKETGLSLNGEFSKQFYQIRQICWPIRLKLEGSPCSGVTEAKQPGVQRLAAKALHRSL